MFPSVTRIRCSCGFLTRDARELTLPLKFDPIFNEYSFEFTVARGSKLTLLLYHCPRCGVVASASDRAKFFAVVSAAELARLKAITGKLRTVQKIETTLGAADEDRAYNPLPDWLEIQPRSGKRETKPIRLMYYRRLSDSADVHFKIYSNGEVEPSIMPKYLGVAPNSARSPRKRQGRSSRSRSTRTRR